MAEAPEGKRRLDQWLWYARMFKSRSLAAKHIKTRKVRVNGTPQNKPSANVAVGDILSFAKADRVRILKVLDLGTRRGPAPEAQSLYDDQSPVVIKEKDKDPADRSPAKREAGAGRPTKAQRRALEKLRPELKGD